MFCEQLFSAEKRIMSKINKISTISCVVNKKYTQAIEIVDKTKHCIDNQALF